MEHDDYLVALPLIDDPTVKDVFAEFCAGLNFVHGNLHMTFASVTADHGAPQAASTRIVLARIVRCFSKLLPKKRDLPAMSLMITGITVPQTAPAGTLP